MSSSFSAPGKLVIAGEYAVLEGFEALSFSINRRARVTITNGGKSRLDLNKNKLVACIFEELRDRGVQVRDSGIEIDSSQLNRSHLKLGVGSSSAIAVALSAALSPEARRSPEIALAAHKRFTNGRGSGIDVATSFYGGAILYRRTLTPLVTLCKLRFDTRQIIAVHTGVAQSTNSLLEKIGEIRSEPAYQKIIAGIGEAAKSIVQSMTHGGEQFATLKVGIADHNRWMNELGALAQSSLLGSEHQAIQSICALFDGIAKPSGAGGGDVSLCFVPLDAHEALKSELRQNGFLPLNFEFCVSGLESD